jgi:hypothetical protein
VSNSLMSYADKPAAMTETGIKNGVLIYNGVEQTNTFTADFFKPYLAYKEGETYKGSLFDSFIILGRKYSPTGEFAQTGNNHANYKEWQEYINKTFADQGALNQLNSASKSLNKKVNVYIAIPYPKQNEAITDLAGKKITNNLDSRYNLVSWYTKNVQQKWNAAGYSHLTFKGYYWLNETVINLQDEMLVEKVSKELDKQNKAFIYSPHALSTNYENWHEYGFDGAYLQPNAFRLSLTDTKARLHKAFLKSQVHGSGINLEIDTYSPHQMDAGLVNFAQYMEIAKQYNLPDQSLILYQGNDMVYRMATYNDSAYQTAYKLLYETIQ